MVLHVLVILFRPFQLFQQFLFAIGHFVLFFRDLVHAMYNNSKRNQRGPMSPRLFLEAMTSSFNVFVRVLVAMDGRE